MLKICTNYMLHILQEMCLEEIKLHAKNMLTILNSIVNMISGDPHDHLLSQENPHFGE